jgi:hypothetical protein
MTAVPDRTTFEGASASQAQQRLEGGVRRGNRQGVK